MKKIKITFVIIIAIFGFLFITLPTQAEDFFYLRTIDYPLSENFRLESPSGEVTLKVNSGSASQLLYVKLMNIVNQNNIANFFTYPESITPASDLYFIKFIPESEDNFFSQPQITIKYLPDDKYKEVYYYSWLNLQFKKIESERDTVKHTITFTLPKKKSLLFALFNESEVIGRASWYVHPKYQSELIAASRDFAIDSQVKVTNLYNNREIIVTIKDYGPKECKDWTELEQQKMGPCQNRILDLSKTAFLKLATTTGVGIISQIKVTPVK